MSLDVPSPYSSSTTPREVLTELQNLGTRTRRRRQRGGWAPLAIFGITLVVADFVARLDPRIREIVVDVGGGTRVAKDQWVSNVAGSPPNLPLSIYWLAAIPLAFALSALWLRRQARRQGVDQPWLPLTVMGLLPFAALVVLRLILEPSIASVHELLAHESPSKYLDPVAFIWIGLVTLAVLERSRPLVALCGTIVALNTALFVLGANGVRAGSWRENLLDGVYRGLGAIGAGPRLLSGLLLLFAAAVWAGISYRRDTVRSQP